MNQRQPARSREGRSKISACDVDAGMGTMVISFDFELAWGIRRSDAGPDQYRAFERVHSIVPELLAILTKHRLSATWATVGRLMLSPADCPQGQYKRNMPAPRPRWFTGEWLGGVPAIGTAEGRRFYAPELVQQIVDCNTRQELACHTFSHVVFGDEACTAEIADSELREFQHIARLFGRTAESIVFPRNQVGHLAAVRENGFRIFRGPYREWWWLGTAGKIAANPWLARCQKVLFAALRFIDEFVAIQPPVSRLERSDGLWCVPHSMFYPGSAGLSRFVPTSRHVSRAVAGMRRAAASQGVFSLYTHPHNFLRDTKAHLKTFDQICTVAERMRDAGELRILTMEELAHEHSRQCEYAA